MEYCDLTPYRQKVYDRIKEYEREGLFDRDVEDDPPAEVLTPEKADYLDEKPFAKLKNRIANKMAVRFFEKQIKNGAFVISGVEGLENYRAVEGGAVITCNHFSIYDNYIVYRAIRNELPKGRQLYKVIREGNYTGFKGLFGFFFRHCNTLPLSSNTETMVKFLKSVKELLKRGEKILIYPEQAMWWNYEKPRPMKSGAFKIAAKNKVPVIPSFITMEETDKKDADGANVLACRITFLPAIYPKEDASEKDNAEYLKDENYKAWKDLYENTYHKELKYGD